ncbi:hypothetical protein JTE90_002510 [Oedothorax gibbosus]|uniref:Uncharacterized protein n=1 Tax=Oedothorax gibbosus TaxID=931172 RepID=A0AAV6THJ8_9ARAC|nr:hypothetical protein JTE90_008344 [Oedothorax gibbosus]KAG8171148.1 hypothetical protein JTE90_023926 [Oedothorax gibbosus]KAG8172306.1 hypothetical protein JTE90_000491 [Oedothorax gibbosus]KAG8172308.1 hypothetical protein JTE90_000493 [Oedothorax gibbosus]KAG8172332.1 hypothetical protein JTE90_005368 [Oedothorax gibbosus]
MPVTALGKRGLGRCDPPHLSDLTQSAKGSGAGPGPLRTRADNEVRRPHVQASLETRMASRAPPTCRRDLMSSSRNQATNVAPAHRARRRKSGPVARGSSTGGLYGTVDHQPPSTTGAPERESRASLTRVCLSNRKGQ